MKPIEIFVDLDGVLADYDTSYRKLGPGAEPSEKGKIKAKRFLATPNFYRHLPLMHDAMELWNFVKTMHPKILSASSNYLPFSKQNKLDWVHEHLGLTGSNVIVVQMPDHKQRYAAYNHVLIDDNTKNCAEWTRAGGIAIVHVTSRDTISQLRSIIAHTTTKHVHETFLELADLPGSENLIETYQRIQNATFCYCSEWPVPKGTCTSCNKF